ncbi:MAG: ABC transporter ATP-binding protein [Rubellimicrobium sp.]|nr:ABC transporter ATP-binding protein [Rubellimicrobium sp.]
MSLLEVTDLSLTYASDGVVVEALRDVSLTVEAGEVVGIVGESGSGKSTLAAVLNGLLPDNARITKGAVRIEGTDLLTLPEAGRRRLRGPGVAMVLQDPMQAFNPVLTIGRQLVDFQHHLKDLSRADKAARAEAMLAEVGISDPAACLRRFPHELSGGMRQRAAIAAALLLTPRLLVADEPTTALDVTMEAQILHLLRRLRTDHAGAIVIITHHLGVVGEICDRVHVMYGGQIVEEGPVDDIHHAPAHPYTQALIACDPAAIPGRAARLPTIPGRPPPLRRPVPKGCAFAPRCPAALPQCRTEAPPRVVLGPRRSALCHRVSP